MSETNLFSFPEGSALPEGGDIFSLGDLGSEPDPGNPFLQMEESTAEEQPTATETAPPAPAEEPSAEPAPEPAPAPAPKPAAAPKAKTPPPPAEDPNPLMAAMDLQEKKNAQTAAQPIFAQLPVFSYNGNEEPIENIDQTFEELRLAKADDFPEFDEAQSISWSVTYGKITKQVSTPRKVKIGDLKREIETSKEFMDALKKAKDKRPKCIVKPTVRMQKKGIMGSYKGVFASLSDARASGKTIAFIPARDGRVYERRVNGAGEYLTPAANVTMLDDLRPGFRPALPPIPYELFNQAVTLFRAMMAAGRRPLEALVNIYWDREEETFFLHVPSQVVGKASVEAVLDDEELLDDDRYIHYADLHSHNDMAAKFSPTDDHDERANRVYLVVGRLDRYYPEISARVCNGGHFHEIDPRQVLEPMPMTAFPLEWLERISCAESELRCAA